MGIAERLKEERQRLGLSQTAFAALAGATKSAQIKWEGGGSSVPTASALAGFADAGADILYIITGKRTVDPDIWGLKISEQLAEIRRRVIDPSRYCLPNQSKSEAEKHVIRWAQSTLRAMLDFDSHLLSKEQIDDAYDLLETVSDPAKLSFLRAGDFVEKRTRRKRTREDFVNYLAGGPYIPSDVVLRELVEIAIDHDVPVNDLAELVYSIATEATGHPGASPDDPVTELPDRTP